MGWLVGWLLIGWLMVGWLLIGWLTGWFVSWLIGSLSGWFTGWWALCSVELSLKSNATALESFKPWKKTCIYQSEQSPQRLCYGVLLSFSTLGNQPVLELQTGGEACKSVTRSWFIIVHMAEVNPCWQYFLHKFMIFNCQQTPTYV